MFVKSLTIATIFFVFLLGMQGARAQALFSLNPASQTGKPGNTLTFNATIINVGTDILYLNGVNSSGLTPGLTLDSTPFFNNFPFFLNGGDATTSDIFTVLIDNNVSAGNYFGSFTITGGADPNAQEILATQNFQVTVAPSAVPAPSALLTIALGILPGMGFLLHRRVSRSFS